MNIYLLLALCLLSAAVGAPVLGLDRRALAIASRALLLHLLHHTRCNLPGNEANAVPVGPRKPKMMDRQHNWRCKVGRVGRGEGLLHPLFPSNNGYSVVTLS